MKKLRLIPKICVWIVNLFIAFMALGVVMTFIGLIPFFGDGKRPESTEGMIYWSGHSSVNMGSYVMSYVSNYKAEESGEGGFTDYIGLKVPFPRAGEVHFDTDSSDFRIINEGGYNMTADLDWDHSRPVVYQFYGEKEQHLVITLFIICVILLFAITFYWLLTLRQLIIAMSRGEFFGMDNFKRLVILSIPAFVIPVIKYLAAYSSMQFFNDNFRIINGGYDHGMNLDLTPMIFGAIFLLMAAMVYEGTKFKEDSDLTI
jgi:hypothetical protein